MLDSVMHYGEKFSRKGELESQAGVVWNGKSSNYKSGNQGKPC